MLPGLRFIVYTTFLKNSDDGIATTIPVNGIEVPVLHYPPLSKEKGLVITFTGFSVHGYQDKRMAVVSQAFSRLGYRVITPRIKTIDELLIHPGAIDEIKAFLQAVSTHTALNPLQLPPAVFAPSFTAGISALAIAQLPVNTVSSLCLLGSFSDFESTIQFALTNEDDADDYGMHILMKNFVKYEWGEQPHLENLIQTAIEDNGLQRQKPLLPSLLEMVPAQTRERYNRLKNDTAFRSRVIMDAWHKIPEFSQWKYQLDLSIHAHRISCPVSVIHARFDPVIPPIQSERLYALLRENNKHVNLEISSLLDHGAVKISPGLLAKVFRLAKAMDFFMRFIGTKQHSPSKNFTAGA